MVPMPESSTMVQTVTGVQILDYKHMMINTSETTMVLEIEGPNAVAQEMALAAVRPSSL
jgi:hypothetical protein